MSETTEAKKTQVVLVEDHPLFRKQLAHLINKELGMNVCGETDNIQQAMTIIEEQRPDIAIVDITLPGSSGLELVKNLKAQELNFPVLILSMHDETVYAERALRAGAKGYITKHEASAEIMLAIRKVLNGEVYLSDAMTARVLKRMSDQRSSVQGSVIDLLTDRELEVFQLLGHGRNTQEIAKELNLGTATVDTYRARIKGKLGLKNTAEVYHRATEWVTEHAA